MVASELPVVVGAVCTTCTLLNCCFSISISFTFYLSINMITLNKHVVHIRWRMCVWVCVIGARSWENIKGLNSPFSIFHFPNSQFYFRCTFCSWCELQLKFVTTVPNSSTYIHTDMFVHTQQTVQRMYLVVDSCFPKREREKGRDAENENKRFGTSFPDQNPSFSNRNFKRIFHNTNTHSWN